MERMGDILAKNATRRASQQRPQSASPEPAARPASAPQAPSRTAPPAPARVQRAAPTTTPLNRRIGSTRPRPGARPPAPPALPADTQARVQPATQRAVVPTDTTPSPAARPVPDALETDRILELPRRGGVSRHLNGNLQPASADEPASPISSGASHGASLPIDTDAGTGTLASARASQRGAGTPSSHAMAPLRELTQKYLTRRPGERPVVAGAAAPEPQPTKGTARPLAADPDVCPLCGGAGFVRLDVPVGDPSFGQAVPCSCKERQLEERHQSELRRLSSLDPFMDKTFATFDPAVPGVREAYEVARRYADDPQGWLVFMGGYGCGKTHLAAAIAHQRLAAGSPVFFSIVPDLLDHLRATFAPTAELRYDDMFDRIREAGLLILDDLGAENGTAWATEKLFQLINYRYNFRIPTVITTNNRLLSHMDERIRSRLSDLSLVRHVTIEAADFRDRHAGRTGRAGGGSGRSSGPSRARAYAR